MKGPRFVWECAFCAAPSVQHTCMGHLCLYPVFTSEWAAVSTPLLDVRLGNQPFELWSLSPATAWRAPSARVSTSRKNEIART